MGEKGVQYLVCRVRMKLYMILDPGHLYTSTVPTPQIRNNTARRFLPHIVYFKNTSAHARHLGLAHALGSKPHKVYILFR
jgi:hypothetical protein